MPLGNVCLLDTLKGEAGFLFFFFLAVWPWTPPLSINIHAKLPLTSGVKIINNLIGHHYFHYRFITGKCGLGEN